MSELSKKEKIAALQGLRDTQGWKVVVDELDNDIKITEAKLHGEAKLLEHETIQGLQRERLDRLELRNLPENLIREFSEEETDDNDFDVYD